MIMKCTFKKRIPQKLDLSDLSDVDSTNPLMLLNFDNRLKLIQGNISLLSTSFSRANVSSRRPTFYP
jgi:ABC-type transporter Mla MlaB component